MADDPVFPRVHTLVVCDGLDEAGEVGVYNLSGVRTHLRAGSFPYTHPAFWVYLQLTGHAGVAACRVAVVRAETGDEVAFTEEEQVQFYGPLEVVLFVQRLPNCTFPAPGLYYVQVSLDGKLLMERMLWLVETEVIGDGRERS
jgi:hypothetical protein